MKRLLVKGFTLIELMIVVAIVAILAAIAIPAYQNYTAKAQLAEAFAFLDAAKTGVAAYYQENGSFTGIDAAKANIDSTAEGVYVTGVDVATTGTTNVSVKANIITTATAATGITAPYIMLVPDVDARNNLTSWVCTSNMKQKYLPSTCTGIS